MKIVTEQSIWCFNFWAGAKDLRDQLTPNELDIIEEQLEDIYPDGLNDTELNDLFWFDPEFVCELLGYRYNDGIVERESSEEEEDE